MSGSQVLITRARVCDGAGSIAGVSMLLSHLIQHPDNLLQVLISVNTSAPIAHRQADSPSPSPFRTRHIYPSSRVDSLGKLDGGSGIRGREARLLGPAEEDDVERDNMIRSC